MKIAYQTSHFRPTALSLIARANLIIEQYQAQGLVLTLRQLYYQFVSRDWLPNSTRSYTKLGVVVSKGRLAGLIDWEAIEDRTRNVRINSHWETPQEIIGDCVDAYQEDKWKGQAFMPEIWIEKEALAGVIERICRQLDVPFFACRGYTSQSEMWTASLRLKKYASRSRQPVIIHLGDHDPSGIDMTRDIRDRLRMFLRQRADELIIERIALNYDQIEHYNPPPNPAKVTDSRFAAYQELYGDESWELDALDPSTLVQLVTDAVKKYRNEKKWLARVKKEEESRQQLRVLAYGAEPKP